MLRQEKIDSDGVRSRSPGRRGLHLPGHQHSRDQLARHPGDHQEDGAPDTPGLLLSHPLLLPQRWLLPLLSLHRRAGLQVVSPPLPLSPSQDITTDCSGAARASQDSDVSSKKRWNSNIPGYQAGWELFFLTRGLIVYWQGPGPAVEPTDTTSTNCALPGVRLRRRWPKNSIRYYGVQP